MSRFIDITIARESEEDLENDLPMTINAHYIIKVAAATEDEAGNASIALASGEYLFVTESYEDLKRMLSSSGN